MKTIFWCSVCLVLGVALGHETGPPKEKWLYITATTPYPSDVLMRVSPDCMLGTLAQCAIEEVGGARLDDPTKTVTIPHVADITIENHTYPYMGEVDVVVRDHDPLLGARGRHIATLNLGPSLPR